MVKHEKELVYDNFLKIIKDKIPERGKLAEKLVNILLIEKEAVYRRLRGEVPFTFTEILTIAHEFGISLDSLIGVAPSRKLAFQLKMTDYIDISEDDFVMYQEFVDVLKVVRNGLYSEYGFASSILTLHFIVEYEYIYKFYILKWAYQFGSPGSARSYSDIKIDERLRKNNEDFIKEALNVTYTYVIWDELLFDHLTNDIKYFANINLIKESEIQLLKQDLLKLLSDMEKMAETGCFNSGNKIHFYVSSLNFETTYTYLETSEYYLTLIKTFSLNEVASLDKEVFHKMKTWIQALKRTSTLISESGEVQRIAFFEKQRKFVENL